MYVKNICITIQYLLHTLQRSYELSVTIAQETKNLVWYCRLGGILSMSRGVVLAMRLATLLLS